MSAEVQMKMEQTLNNEQTLTTPLFGRQVIGRGVNLSSFTETRI